MSARDARAESPSRTGVEPPIPRGAALLRPLGSLGVPVPAYEGRSLPNVTSTVLRALGAEAPPTALPPLAADLDPFAGRRADGPVLLFVVDGLGLRRLEARATRPGGGWASAWLGRTAPLTTVFPSTTTSALVSLSTASSPSRHGVVGYRQFLPGFGSVVDVLRLSPLGVGADEALVGPAWSPAVVSGAPSVFRAALPQAVAVSRDRFEGRGFTRLLYDGAGYRAYASWADFAGALAEVLATDPVPPLVTAYWDEVDLIEHLRGPGAPEVDLELDRLPELLRFVARRLGAARAGRTTVLLTADHGLVPADPALQVALEARPEVVALLDRPPGGDRRAALLRARPGKAEALAEELARWLPAGRTLLRGDLAIREGLFGPPPFHPELAERVGDLVVLVPSPSGMTYTVPGSAGKRRALRGAHGGLEPEELLVPLVCGTLADLGGT